MKKRGICLQKYFAGSHSAQIISFDLLLGILIFIGAFIFVLKQIDSLVAASPVKLKLEPDLVFNSLELNIKNQEYEEQTGNKAFLDNYKIDESQLMRFERLPYNDNDNNDFNDLQSLVIKKLGVQNLDVSFCVYFEDKSSNIIPVNEKSGIGLSDSEAKIFVGRNNFGMVECGSLIDLNFLLPSMPQCSDYYTHSLNIFKPVIRQGKIMKMNILFCGK
ncbi:hypothetical protein HYY70_04680 [Candidatus Woesearchaeota archaeon]|nr:hypothetical protein [Candidatus Woesearchaeota archaeon]